MPSGAQRLAMQQLDRAPDVADLPQGTITAVAAGGAPDGNALVTVTYLGASLQFPYFPFYTPVVGHVVSLVRSGGQWTILGRPIGHPPLT